MDDLKTKILLDMIIKEFGLDMEKLLAIALEEIVTTRFEETSLPEPLRSLFVNYRQEIDLDKVSFETIANDYLKGNMWVINLLPQKALI